LALVSAKMVSDDVEKPGCRLEQRQDALKARSFTVGPDQERRHTRVRAGICLLDSLLDLCASRNLGCRFHLGWWLRRNSPPKFLRREFGASGHWPQSVRLVIGENLALRT